MANTVTGNISFVFETLHSFVTGGSRGTRNDRIAGVTALKNAVTGQNYIDRAGGKFQQSLAASGATTYDLAGTSFTDPEGTALTMAKLKLIVLLNWNIVSGDYLTLRMAASAGLANGTLMADVSDKITIQPTGGACPFVWPATLFGVAVTATTADSFTIDNPSGNTITYDIIVAGTST